MTDRSEHARLYKPSAKTPLLVDVPPMRFLLLDSSDDIEDAAAAIITLAYQVKFAARRSISYSYKVGPLEILHLDTTPAANRTEHVAGVRRLMIGLPDEIEREVVETVRAKAAVKKGLPLLNEVRVQTFSEGESVQILELGMRSGATTDRLRRFAAEKKREFSGPRHEIHLNDPARTAPEKLKTIVRYPVRHVG